MNDELEIIEEFQSDSINELVSERKKNKAVQIFMMQPSTFTKYYYIENYPNGDSLKISVNSGPSTAIRSLQKVLNKKGYNLKEDGYIGDKTNQAVNSVDEKWLKKELQKSRAEHCDSIVDKNPNQERYIKGWFKRINDIGNKFGCDTIFKSRHPKK